MSPVDHSTIPKTRGFWSMVRFEPSDSSQEVARPGGTIIAKCTGCRCGGKRARIRLAEWVAPESTGRLGCTRCCRLWKPKASEGETSAATDGEEEGESATC